MRRILETRAVARGGSRGVGRSGAYRIWLLALLVAALLGVGCSDDSASSASDASAAADGQATDGAGRSDGPVADASSSDGAVSSDSGPGGDGRATRDGGTTADGKAIQPDALVRRPDARLPDGAARRDGSSPAGCGSWSGWTCASTLIGCTASCHTATSVRAITCAGGSCDCKVTTGSSGGGTTCGPVPFGSTPCAQCQKAFTGGCCKP